GYKHIILSPHTGSKMNNVAATFMSMYGEIKSAWEIKGDNFIYTIEIPTNTTATVTLPLASKSNVTVNSKTLTDELKSKAIQNDTNLVIELGSGKYEFKYPYEIQLNEF
ncbi:MAG: family 78 glycoside hydrolase catalytic domain, partial [Draconibacterium sp.]|nr:family 78 glycoside hydrolase catalytic domain [Draconibacterium sp.]